MAALGFRRLIAILTALLLLLGGLFLLNSIDSINSPKVANVGTNIPRTLPIPVTAGSNKNTLPISNNSFVPLAQGGGNNNAGEVLGMPLDLKVTPTSNGELLTWAPPQEPNNSALGYVITATDISQNTSIKVTVPLSVLSYLLQGLNTGDIYNFSVASIGASTSGNSVSKGPMMATAVPPAVKHFFVTVGDRQASLSWVDSTNLGDIASEIEIVEINFSNASMSKFYIQGNANSFLVNNLTNGDSYQFEISAINSVGQGLSTTSNTVIPAGVPFAVPSLGATASDQNVSLSWSAPNDNGSSITGYSITVNDLSSKTSQVINLTTTSTTYTVNNLTNGDSYQFEISAINSVGQGLSTTSNTVIISVSQLVVSTAYGTPTGLYGYLVANGLQLNWMFSGGSSGFKITVQDMTSGISTTYTQASSNNGYQSFIVPSINSGDSYKFSIAAYGLNWISPSASITLTIPPQGQSCSIPGPVQNLSSYPNYSSNEYIGLSWGSAPVTSNSPDCAVEGYAIVISSVPTGYVFLGNVYSYSDYSYSTSTSNYMNGCGMVNGSYWCINAYDVTVVLVAINIAGIGPGVSTTQMMGSAQNLPTPWYLLPGMGF